MTKIHPYYFSAEDLMKGCRRCIENVKGLLDSAKILLGNSRTEVFALGLYIYAVEEYGKAIGLRKSITGNKSKYQIDGWILGHGDFSDKITSHDAKIKLGFDNLPPTCRLIVRGVTIREASPLGRTITVKEDETGQINSIVSVQPNSTGNYVDTTNLNVLDYNLDLKTACFYINWDIKNKRWTYELATDKQLLIQKIESFENALVNFNHVT